MKLTGVEGMSPEDIRNEIDRGGKLVIYTYCVSILVMTFKRPTDIRLVRAGHNPVVAGLPYTFISLIFGWWGFPWGPIYTIETIYRNLSGGIDVSADVLRSILPTAPAAGAPPPVSTAQPQSFNQAPASPQRGINFKTIGLMAAVASFLVALGITIYCYNEQRSLKVALISAIGQPYSVTLNGESYTLHANGATVVEMPEGDIILADDKGGHIVGSPQTLHFALPFFDHLFQSKLAVINPDATAIVYREQVPYYKDGTAPGTPAEGNFTVFANRQSYFLDRPEFIFESAPQRTSMPSGTTVLYKSRVDSVAKADELGGVLTTVKEKLGYPALVEHFNLVARHRSDEALLRAAMVNLKQEDWVAFYRPRLADRPLLIEWHRYYQRAVERTQPNHDLAGEYRGYLKAEPDNSALLYLTGRVIDDRAESHALWQKALSVDPPCAYANAAFGFDALSDGDFEQAAAQYAACHKAGIISQAQDYYRQATWWALGNYPAILEMVRAKRKAAPFSLELAANEIRALIASNPDPNAANNARSQFLAAATKARFSDADLKTSQAYLDAVIAYQTDHIPEYLAAVKQLDAPAYRFEAALTRGDLKAAEAANKENGAPTSEGFLLLYLLATRNGDAADAERLYTSAIDTMRTESREKRAAARLLSASPVSVTEICQLGLDPGEKTILLTAAGVHDSAHRATFHALAAKLNFLPAFPQRFLSVIHKL